MVQKEDGSFIASKEELLNEGNKLLANFYIIDEHQFHILIKNDDSQFDNFASKVFYIALGIILQVLVYFVFVCYYQLMHNKVMVDTTLSKIDKFQFGLLVLCLIISIVLKAIGHFRHSERKQLISDIKKRFKK